MNNNNSIIFGNNLNNIGNNLQNNFGKLDSKYKIIIFVAFLIFIIFVGFIAYIYWNNYKTNKVQSFQEETLLDGMYDCNNRKSPMKIEPSKIPASTMGSEYSLNLWIYVAEALNRDGYVLKRGPAGGNITTECFPGIILKKDTNDMVIYFKKETGNVPDSVSTFTGDYTIEHFHSDEGRLVEGLENLEHFYGMNDQLENNYIIEGFNSDPTPEQLNGIFQVIKDKALQNEFQFTIPEEKLDANSDISSLKVNPLLVYIIDLSGQYTNIINNIMKILDFADNKDLKLSDKEIDDIYTAVEDDSSVTWTDASSVVNSQLDTILTKIKNALEPLINTNTSYIKSTNGQISENDTDFNRILDGAKKIHHKKDDDDGTEMDEERKKYMKKELIKLYINDINNINLEDEEITKMVELILNIKDGNNVLLPDNDSSTGNRKTAIDNIYGIVTGIRNLINIMLGNDTSLSGEDDYNKYPNLKLEVPTRNIIVTQILDTIFTQYDFTYDTQSSNPKKTDIIKLLIIKLDIVNSGGNLSSSGIRGVNEYNNLISEENYITVQNIPLQRWTCLNISVFNQTVDIYVDGKLKNSKNFRFSLKPPRPLPMTLGPVHETGMGSGFNGFLSRIKYSNRALNPGQVRQRYEEGPRITKGLWESFKSFFSSSEGNVEE